MSDEPVPHTGAMEGKGAYNLHSRIPAAGGSLAIPLFEAAAQRIPIDTTDRPIVIADYGSSEGKNSLAPIHAAVGVLRSRIGAERPIIVYHTDLPGNDFNSLFNVVDNEPGSYARQDTLTFPCAIGRSFYRQVLPTSYVDLAWSSYAAVWLSQVPCQIPDHIFIPCAGEAIRAKFDHQAALDWSRFLALRANELRPGGRLVVALPSLEHDGSTDFAALMNHANAVIAKLVDEGMIRSEERARMTLASHPRREKDLMAPFVDGGQYAGLLVEHVSTAHATDTAWTEFETDHDAVKLASKRALFFRVIFAPSLAQSLSPERTMGERLAFINQLEQGICQRLVGEPSRLDHLVGIIVLAKQKVSD